MTPTYIVAEIRFGKPMLGDDWRFETDDLETARDVRDQWITSMYHAGTHYPPERTAKIYRLTEVDVTV